jgi:hypothetical protein
MLVKIEIFRQPEAFFISFYPLPETSHKSWIMKYDRFSETVQVLLHAPV